MLAALGLLEPFTLSAAQGPQDLGLQAEISFTHLFEYVLCCVCVWVFFNNEQNVRYR